MANEMLAGLESNEREALLIRCWMSHDAYWYGAVGAAHGMEAVNRANQMAVRQLGRTEARRIARVVDIAPIATVDDMLRAQETMIALLGSDLLDYRIEKVGTDGYRVAVQRCFAHENVTRAGCAADHECGIFARVQSWFEGLGAEIAITPSIGKCLKAAGGQCVYTLKLRATGEGSEP